MSQYQNTLNALLKAKLQEINTAVERAIRSHGLDPKIQVASGSQIIGSINCGNGRAEATAKYTLKDLTGLSSITIDSLTITSTTPSADEERVHGSIALSASMLLNLNTNLGGTMTANCGFFKPSHSLIGNVVVPTVTVTATGNFQAMVGREIALTEINIAIPSLNYGTINVNIDGLGTFSPLYQELENFILGIMKNKVIKNIEDALTQTLNRAINSQLLNTLVNKLKQFRTYLPCWDRVHTMHSFNSNTINSRVLVVLLLKHL